MKEHLGSCHCDWNLQSQWRSPSAFSIVGCAKLETHRAGNASILFQLYPATSTPANSPTRIRSKIVRVRLSLLGAAQCACTGYLCSARPPDRHSCGGCIATNSATVMSSVAFGDKHKLQEYLQVLLHVHNVQTKISCYNSSSSNSNNKTIAVTIITATRFKSSGMLQCRLIITDISEDRSVIISRVASSSYSMCTLGTFPGKKWLGHEAHRWLQSNAQIKKAWGCTSTTPCVVFLAFRGTT
jgi:hypothetical protein